MSHLININAHANFHHTVWEELKAMQSISNAVVKSIQLFSTLQTADCDAIARRATLASFKAGEQIVSRRDSRRELYCLVSGTVHVTSFGLNGREISYKEKHGGDIFGELSAIDSEPRSADVIAKTDVTLFALSHEHFNELLQLHPSIAISLLTRFASEIRSLTSRVYSFSAMSVSNRIRQMVLQMAEDYSESGRSEPVTIEFPTHAQVASRVATTREAVTREISSLSSAGIVQKVDNGLRVVEVQKLRDLIESELG